MERTHLCTSPMTECAAAEQCGAPWALGGYVWGSSSWNKVTKAAAGHEGFKTR